jgi:hypothetical protein
MESAEIKQKITDYLDNSGLSATELGLQACKDARIVGAIMSGTRIHGSSREKLLAYMAANPGQFPHFRKNLPQLVIDAEAQLEAKGGTVALMMATLGFHFSAWLRWKKGESVTTVKKWKRVRAYIDEFKQSVAA